MNPYRDKSLDDLAVELRVLAIHQQNLRDDFMKIRERREEIYKKLHFIAEELDRRGVSL